MTISSHLLLFCCHIVLLCKRLLNRVCSRFLLRVVVSQITIYGNLQAICIDHTLEAGDSDFFRVFDQQTIINR